MANILIVDANTVYHIGNAALLESTIEQLKTQFPEATITILAFDPDSIAKTFPEYKVLECLWAKPFSSHSFIGKIKWIFLEGTWAVINAINCFISRAMKFSIKPSRYTFSPAKRAVMQAYTEADIVVSISGEMLNQLFWKRLPMFLYGYWLGHIMGKTVAIFPQSISYFENIVVRKAVRYVLNKCDLVLPRDQISLQNVKKLGIKNSKVYLVPDVAINQPYIESEKAIRLLKEEGINFDKRPLVGITISKFNEYDYQRYIPVVKELCHFIVTNIKGMVVFVSPNMPYKQEISDLSLAQRLHQELYCKDNVKLLTKLYRPSEFKSMLGELDLFISTRMHVSILSTMISTPTITINSQPKLRGYMEMIAQEEWACDVNNFTIEKGKQMVRKILAQNVRVRESLVKARIEVGREALMATKLLKDIYDQKLKKRNDYSHVSQVVRSTAKGTVASCEL